MQYSAMRQALESPLARLDGSAQVLVKYYDSGLGWTTKTLNRVRVGEDGELILMADPN
jgi:hypothetical protein